MIYMITTKGRAVLRGATLWGLSRHLRDLLALCDPALRVDQARQFMPPESLQATIYALQQLELIDGPPAEPPRSPDWAMDTTSRRLAASRRDPATTPTA